MDLVWKEDVDEYLQDLYLTLELKTVERIAVKVVDASGPRSRWGSEILVAKMGHVWAGTLTSYGQCGYGSQNYQSVAK